MGLNSRRWWMPVAVRNVWARAIWRRSLRRPPPRRPVGWMGHWALKRFPSSPYLAARSVIQDALCIYIAGSSSSSSSSIGINWACPKGEERRQLAEKKERIPAFNSGWLHLWPLRVEGWRLFGSWIPKAAQRRAFNVLVATARHLGKNVIALSLS